jgi:tripartite-type tricarboxylate transporter receptor subunit TctC
VGVPYRGSGEAARNVAAGGIDGTFAYFSQAKPLSDDGKLRALAVASAHRIASWPDVATMEELGYPNFDHRGFVGLAAPAKTPAAIIAFLNKELNDVVQSQPFRQRMGGARHDGACRQHAAKARRVHAPRNRTSGCAGQALGPSAHRAAALSGRLGRAAGRRVLGRVARAPALCHKA